MTVFHSKKLAGWLYVLLIWLSFEDLVRRYLRNNMRITYLSIIVAIGQRRGVVSPALSASDHPFFRSAALQVLDPGMPNVWCGLFVFKPYFYYFPMMFVGHALIENEVDLNRFLFINKFLTIVIEGLGIAQSILGARFVNPTLSRRTLRSWLRSIASPPFAAQYSTALPPFSSVMRFLSSYDLVRRAGPTP